MFGAESIMMAGGLTRRRRRNDDAFDQRPSEGGGAKISGGDDVQFLSYAVEDSAVGRHVADLLRANGVPVFDWQDPQQRGDRFIQKIEQQINQADGFLALLSPSFLASPWCRLERDLALQRGADLQASGRTGSFIHVLKVRDTFVSEAGFLRIWDILDLTDADTRDSVLMSLVGTLGSGGQPAPASTDLASRSTPAAPLFRNRINELETVVRGLTNPAGPHFWLVSAPPELGKSWFLSRLPCDVVDGQPSPWTARLVDLRQQPSGMRDDAAAILAVLFDQATPMTTDRAALRRCARAVTEREASHLCLLDSAELLTEGTAKTLRSCLAQIYDLIRGTGDIDVRLGFVVASRHGDVWRGVTPSPRLSMLSLTEFDVHIVEQALLALASKRPSPATLRRFAAQVHSFSEGLPALLVRCLHWIRRERWMDMDRIETPGLFTELAHPYIKEVLLSATGLFPSGEESQAEALRALDLAFRALAPYRFFTQSHLRDHLDTDQEFSRVLTYVGWSLEDLWAAISATALLRRPLDEPWQEILPAIRRLLYRYYYETVEQQVDAHRRACAFVGAWAAKQPGKEQVVGMAECLWHTAEMLRLAHSDELDRTLSDLAAELSLALNPSDAYVASELQSYAVEHLAEDEEFQKSIEGVSGLLERIIEIIESPQQESQHE